MMRISALSLVFRVVILQRTRLCILVSLHHHSFSESSADDDSGPEAPPPAPYNPLLVWSTLIGLCLLLGVGYLGKDSIRDFLQFFISVVDDWGPWGYGAYALVYTALEVLCVPAIPLTMTAGSSACRLYGNHIYQTQYNDLCVHGWGRS